MPTLPDPAISELPAETEVEQYRRYEVLSPLPPLHLYRSFLPDKTIVIPYFTSYYPLQSALNAAAINFQIPSYIAYFIMYVWPPTLGCPSWLVFLVLDTLLAYPHFMHSFIHSGHFFGASSSPLLLTVLRSAPDTARILCLSFTPKRHTQLRVKDLPKVPYTWQLYISEISSACRPEPSRFDPCSSCLADMNSLSRGRELSWPNLLLLFSMAPVFGTNLLPWLTHCF